eukprot:jgi/Tetstr1/439497/TSEL_027927.t2
MNRMPAGVEPAEPSSHAEGGVSEAWSADFHRDVLPRLEALRRGAAPAVAVAVMRSSQLDAARLDWELQGMAAQQLARALGALNPAWVARVQPELDAGLDLLFFLLTVWRGRPTPGMSLMGLRFRDERARRVGQAGGSGLEGRGLSTAQRWVYGLVSVGGTYAWRRAHQHAAEHHWRDAPQGSWQRAAWRTLAAGDNMLAVGRLTNMLLFLRLGDYRSMLERLLRARLVYTQASMQRAISFEYLSRQLVWQELSELLLNVLPLLDPEKLRARLLRWLPPAVTLLGARHRHVHIAQYAGSGEAHTPFSAEPCGHTFCYYCLRARTQADRQYSCPICGVRVDGLRRPDVRATKTDAKTQ